MQRARLVDDGTYKSQQLAGAFVEQGLYPAAACQPPWHLHLICQGMLCSSLQLDRGILTLLNEHECQGGASEHAHERMLLSC
jgi:hypothetical protein